MTPPKSPRPIDAIALRLLLGALTLCSVSCGKAPSSSSGDGDTPSHDAPAYDQDDAPPTAQSPRLLSPVPEFTLTDQTDAPFGTEDLDGTLWVANFIFTRCPATCPIQTQMMAELQDRLADHSGADDVKLVSFSVDPDYDRPDVLTAYAKNAGADEDRWRFLTGTRDQIWNLSKDGFKLPVGEAPENANSPLFHSPQLILVDGGGRIRGYFDGMSEEGLDEVERAVDLVLAESAPKPHAAQIADPAQVGVPAEIFDPPWLDERRRAQLATVPEFGCFTDFSFADRRADSGITFNHRIVDDAGTTYKSAHYDHGNGVAVADVDGDRRLDLYFVNQVGRNELWRNLGDGRFEDITDRAGVAVKTPIGVTASFADIDNDGDPDLFVTTVRGGNVLFENDGTGSFTDVTASSGLGGTAAHSSGAVFFDYDRDGLLDLFLANVGKYTSDLPRTVTNDDGRDDGDEEAYVFTSAYEDAFGGQLKPERYEQSILYRNLGDGQFQDVTEAAGLTDVSWTGDATPLDANGDGWIDLYVLDMQGHDEYFENVGGQRFERRSRDVFPETPWGSMGVKVFDFDNDGNLDIYVTDMHSDMSIDVGVEKEKDKSDMQWPESFLRSDGMSIFGNAFFRNMGDGTYEEISDAIGAENYWPWGLSVGDLNADGYEDVFVASSMNYPFRYGVNSVLLNDGGERLRDSEFILGVEPRRPALAKPWFTLDCSGDDWGHRECEGREGEIVVWGALGSRSSVIFDLDSDGDLDIVTNDFNSEPLVLVSDLTERTSVDHLTIDLVGTTSNRSGLGAVVTVRAGDVTQTKAHDGQSGYLSQSLMPLYFGLGGAENVDEITVRWPSGKTQVVPGPIAANRVIEIVEE